MIEKAYAQWNASGREGRDGQNGYASLADGCMQDVDGQVLGQAAAVYCPAGGATVKQAVIAALQSGAAVTAAIFLSGDATAFNPLGLVSDHAYEVAGYDANPASPTFDTFQLRNPWGIDEPTAALTWSDLVEYCPWLAVADAPSSATNSPAGSASGQEIHAAALQAVTNRQFAPAAAWLADLANHGNRQAGDTMRDFGIRALEIVLAESGR